MCTVQQASNTELPRHLGEHQTRVASFADIRHQLNYRKSQLCEQKLHYFAFLQKFSAISFFVPIPASEHAFYFKPPAPALPLKKPSQSFLAWNPAVTCHHQPANAALEDSASCTTFDNDLIRLPGLVRDDRSSVEINREPTVTRPRILIHHGTFIRLSGFLPLPAWLARCSVARFLHRRRPCLQSTMHASAPPHLYRYHSKLRCSSASQMKLAILSRDCPTRAFSLSARPRLSIPAMQNAIVTATEKSFSSTATFLRRLYQAMGIAWLCRQSCGELSR